MSLEIYWKKALEQSRLSIDDESLYPLKTDIITRDLYEKDDFVIRRLDTSKFNKKKIYGPKQNPFCPWEKILEIDKIGDTHQLILNKYPVQKGHILLITNEWKPQNGWLDIKDWRAIQQVNKDTVDYGFSTVLLLRVQVNLTGIFNFCVDLEVRYHALEKSGF